MIGVRTGSLSQKTKIGLGIGGIGLLGLSFSSKDDHYNTIEGLRHGGMSQGIRRSHSDFGSGYRGMPDSLMGVTLDKRILDYRKDVIESGAYKDVEEEIAVLQKAQLKSIGSFADEDFYNNKSGRKHMSGLSATQSNLRDVKLSNFDMEVEDADTLILKRKGLLNMFSNPIQIRLAGIDAPETAAHSGDPLAPVRYEQNQPFGEQASDDLRALIEQQDKVTLKVGTEKTYGRYVGALVGDSSVLNVDLARMGSVAALPFGKVAKDVVSRSAADRAQSKAQAEEKGIWSMARYKAIDKVQDTIGQSVTFNTLSRIDKLSKNLNLGAYSSLIEGLGSQQRDLSSKELQSAERIGRVLRKTHGPKKKYYNKFEGLHPGSQGMGAQSIRKHTEFGSGWLGIKKLFSKTVSESAVKSTLSEPVQKLMGAMKAGGTQEEILKRAYESFGAKRITSSSEMVQRMAGVDAEFMKTASESLKGSMKKSAASLEKQGFTSMPKEGIVFAGRQRKDKTAQMMSEFHELLEIGHTKLGINASEKFGSHVSRSIIEDEALIRLFHSKKSFKAGQVFRQGEGGTKHSMSQAKRSYEKTAKKVQDLKARGDAREGAIAIKQEAANFMQYKTETLDIYRRTPERLKALETQIGEITLVTGMSNKAKKQFRTNSQNAVGAGLKAAKNAKGHGGFASTQGYN